jgi:two-component system OmpR family sensor kinase
VRDEIARDLAELDALVEEILLASPLDHIEKLERVEPMDLLGDPGPLSF